MNIGKYTYGHWNTILHFADDARFTCGKFCSLANNLNIYLGGNHRTDWISTFPFGHIYQDIFDGWDGVGHPTTKGDVVVGNDVWIGANVTIMSGVRIGDGVVIAANSHVIKDADSYTIIGGNPAKFIKKRFTEDQIKQLLEIKWWDWDDMKINRFLPYLCSSNVDEFIKKASDETCHE